MLKTGVVIAELRSLRGLGKWRFCLLGSNSRSGLPANRIMDGARHDKKFESCFQESLYMYMYVYNPIKSRD